MSPPRTANLRTRRPHRAAFVQPVQSQVQFVCVLRNSIASFRRETREDIAGINEPYVYS